MLMLIGSICKSLPVGVMSTCNYNVLPFIKKSIRYLWVKHFHAAKGFLFFNTKRFDGFENEIAKMSVKLFCYPFHFFFVFLRKGIGNIRKNNLFSITNYVINKKVKTIRKCIQHPIWEQG